jgi:Divergent InlB B-repeat domain
MRVHRQKTGFPRRLSEVARARGGFAAGFCSGMVLQVVGAILAGIVVTGAASAAQLTLEWVDNSGGTAGFQIERRTGATGAFGQIASIGAGVTSHVDSTVPTGSTVCYRVRASNAWGASDYSNVACAAGAASSLDLTVLRTGAGFGTMTSQPLGIGCGVDCAESFLAGTVVTLTATPANGSTFSGWSGGGCTGTDQCVIAGNTPRQVTATFVNDTLPGPPPAIALAFAGFARDRVGPGESALAPNGVLDGTFTLTLAPGSGARTITRLELRRQKSSGVWDTAPTSASWILGVASRDGRLLNAASGVNVRLAAGASVTLFAADMADLFAPGSSFTITATFADGSTASATAETH